VVVRRRVTNWEIYMVSAGSNSRVDSRTSAMASGIKRALARRPWMSGLSGRLRLMVGKREREMSASRKKPESERVWGSLNMCR
jgi:hypothetical protein